MMKIAIEIKVGYNLPFKQVINLYNSVNWLAYMTKEQGPKLLEAIQNSTFVVSAWREKKMIGLARCMSDDVSICYLQDILVDPECQRDGIGRKLLQSCLKRFEHVRMKVLLTDDERRQKIFYESLGYKNTKDLDKIKLNAFVQIRGVELL